eukprot:RCo023360
MASKKQISNVAYFQERLKRLMEEDQTTSSHILPPVPLPEEHDEAVTTTSGLDTSLQDVSYEQKVADLYAIDEETAFRQHEQAYRRQQVQNEEQALTREIREVLEAESSDDSDGIDADYDAEWRDHTRIIFAACHEVELRHSDAGCNELADLLEDAHPPEGQLTLSEVQMLWDAVRFVYRSADPVHNKHWLSSTNEILSQGHLQSRVSLVNYLHVMQAALRCPFFSSRHRRKIEKWASRTMVLFHKRLIRLKDYGIEEPTWFQVNVCHADRQECVPIHYLWKLAERNASRGQSAVSPTSQSDDPSVDSSVREAGPGDATKLNFFFKPVNDCGPIFDDRYSEERRRNPSRKPPNP